MRRKLYSITLDELILLRETLHSILTQNAFNETLNKKTASEIETCLDIVKMIISDDRPTIGTSVN